MSERPDVLPRARIWQLALVLNVVLPPAGYAYVGAWRAVVLFAVVLVVGMVGLTEWTVAAPPGLYGLGVPGVIVLALSLAVVLGVHAAWIADDAPARSGSRLRNTAVYLATGVAVLSMAQLFYAFWPHAFYVVGASTMAPTLRDGDIVAVNGARARCDGPEPRIGDVVLLRRDGRPGTSMDRLVAGPGQIVEIKDGQLIVNGRRVARDGVGEEPIEFRARPATVVEETLPGGPRYRTFDQGRGGLPGAVAATRTPDAAWYALGDNRDNSADSRVNGPIPRRNICGTVFRIISSQDKSRVGAKPPDPAQTLKPDVDIVTFGCRLNAYESEVIRARAAEDGLSDAVVFNTCAVTGEAVRQARQAIRKARRERPGAKLIVTGCAAQIDPAAFAAMPEVDLVLGNAEKSAPGAYLPTPLGSEGSPMRVRVNDIMSVRETAGHLVDGLKDRARAYVEVQNGCDHRCTFCIIPYGRGNSRSAAAGEVVAQVQRLAAQGYQEVVLTGVDVTSWGADLPGQPTLGQLVARILKLVPDLPRLRLSSIDAAEIDADLLRCLRDEPRLMPYLHLSLQAGDDMILKRMKRRHSRADALKLIADVRAVRPDTAFGADFIAGFPTETEAMFENTLKLVEEGGLAFLHVFPYSARPGTPAARMPAVKGDVVKARAARLRAAGDAALARHLDRQVGRVLKGLVERPGVARAEDFAEIAFEGETAVGGVAALRVTGHDGRRLIARLAVLQAAE